MISKPFCCRLAFLLGFRNSTFWSIELMEEFISKKLPGLSIFVFLLYPDRWKSFFLYFWGCVFCDTCVPEPTAHNRSFKSIFNLFFILVLKPLEIRICYENLCFTLFEFLKIGFQWCAVLIKSIRNFKVSVQVWVQFHINFVFILYC